MRKLVTSLMALTMAAALPACGDGVPRSAGVDQKVTDARTRNDGPAIWVAKDYDSTLYLFGTVHLLPENLSWQKEDMRQAFQEAGTVFFEVDTGPDGQIAAAVLTTSLGMRSDGLRLSDGLDNYQRNLLEAAANNGNLTIASLDAMKPWLATEFLSFSAARNAGLNPELAADEALDKAEAICHQLIEDISQPHDIDTHTVKVGASIGLALHPQHSSNTENLARLADLALYAAKAQGKGRVVTFKPEMAESPFQLEAPFPAATLAQSCKMTTTTCV